MPDVGINHLTKSKEKHNKSLRDLGLLDAKDNPTWMVKGANGKTDWMQSILKLSPILGSHLQALPETQRLQMLDQVFGKQGGRQAGLANLPEFIGQFPRLAQLMASAPGGDDFLKQLSEGSPVQKAREAFSDLKNILMDLGSVVLPPLTATLKELDGYLKNIQPFLPKPGGGQGWAVLKGFGTGALLGGAGGSIVPGIGTFFGAVGGGLVGGAIAGKDHLNSHGFDAPPPSTNGMQKQSWNLSVDGRTLAQVTTKYQAGFGEWSDSKLRIL